MASMFILAFDPIFFLHHANVDRLLSMWSAIHPGVWLSAGDSEAGTFTLAALAPVDNTTCELLTIFVNMQSELFITFILSFDAILEDSDYVLALG
jgi:tyrosinase